MNNSHMMRDKFLIYNIASHARKLDARVQIECTDGDQRDLSLCAGRRDAKMEIFSFISNGHNLNFTPKCSLDLPLSLFLSKNSARVKRDGKPGCKLLLFFCLRANIET